MSTASDPSLNAGIAPLSEPDAHSSSSAGPNASLDSSPQSSPQSSPIPGPIAYGPRQLTLVLGGARSGKSHYAEQIAADHATITGGPVTYVATAMADDDVADEEMQLRIALHRARRPPDWQLVEEPVHLADALYAHARREGCIVVDCITLWLNNLLFLDNKPYPEHGLITPPPAFTEETDALLAALPTLPGHVVLVSNEIGLGVVPMGSVSRFYVDELGRLNQKLAAVADRVRLLVAGLPVAVKGADPAW